MIFSNDPIGWVNNKLAICRSNIRGKLNSLFIPYRLFRLLELLEKLTTNQSIAIYRYMRINRSDKSYMQSMDCILHHCNLSDLMSKFICLQIMQQFLI